MKRFDFFIHDPMNAEGFFSYFEALVRGEKSDCYDESQRGYVPLNFQRYQRVLKTYEPDKELLTYWVNQGKSFRVYVITEPWCGDGAQIVPVAVRFFDKLNFPVTIILRDQNPHIMDHYLTEGTKRSIPIVIVCDAEGCELFHWGPRPRAAQQVWDDTMRDTGNKDLAKENLQRFYNSDRGRSIERELTEKLRETLSVADR